MTEEVTVFIRPNENFTYKTPFQTINIVQMSEDEQDDPDPQPPVNPLALELSPPTVPIPTSTPAKLQTIANQTLILTITPLQESFNGNVDMYYLECDGSDSSETTRTTYTDALRCEAYKLHVIFYKITGDPTVYYTIFVPTSALQIPSMGPTGGEYYIYIGNNQGNNTFFLTDKDNEHSEERKVTLDLDVTNVHWISDISEVTIYKWENPTVNILPNN